MGPFVRTGVWWRPEAPDNKVYGTLTCSASGELRLDLAGSLVEWDDRQARAAVVLGEAPDDGSTGPAAVTLRRCLLTGSKVWSGSAVRRQLFVATRGLFGAHLPEGDDAPFDRLTLGYTALDAWADGLTGFRRDGSGLFRAEWVQPEPVTGEYPGGRFKIAVGATGSQRLRRELIEEKVGFAIDLDQPRPTGWLEEHFVYPLQNFLSFAADRPCALADYRVGQAGDPDETVEVIGPRVQPADDGDEAREFHPHRMLFTLADVRDRVDVVLGRWLELSVERRAAFAIYFSTLYAPPSYIDFRFQQLAQAVALYHSAAGGGADDTPTDRAINTLRDQPTHDRQVWDVVRAACDTHPLVLAERALRALVTRHRPLFEPLVGDAEGFVRRAVQTLTYLITRREPAGQMGTPLFWLGVELEFLFKTAVLRDLGLSSDEVSRLLNRNELFNFARIRTRQEG